MVPADFLELVGVDDVRISPADKSVVFVRSRFDLEADCIQRSLWRIGADRVARSFTSGANDRSPRFSSDGSVVAFLRTTGGLTRLYVLRCDGGEAQAVGPEFARCGAPAWSSDGSKIALCASVEYDAAATNIALDTASGARHITALPYKSDVGGLFDGTRQHAHVIDLESGRCEAVTSGAFDVGGAAWSPNGLSLAFVSNRDTPEAAFTNTVYALDLRDRTQRRLTTQVGIFGPPVFSLDGSELATIATLGDDFAGSTNPQLCTLNLATSKLTEWTAREAWLGDAIASDLRAHDAIAPQWLSDGSIASARSVEGACSIVAIDRNGMVRDLAAGEREVFAFDIASDGTIAFCASEPLLPGDVFIIEQGAQTKLTDVNRAWLKAHPPRRVDRFRPTSGDGTQLDAWKIGADARSAPVVLAIHGGPHAAYGFAYCFEFQMLASLGIHVVYGNPRGSQSYGEAYARAITGHWGERDAEDLHAILDAFLETGGDARRVGVQGGSYGGLMTTWLLGHCERFVCGVSMRAVNDYASFSGASDVSDFMEREMEAPWTDAGRKLFESSPIRSVAAISAPLLIMHSERDLRCPIDQAEQLFSRLRQMGREAEFVRFIRDGHDLSRLGTPRNRVLRYRAIAHWLLLHLGLNVPEDRRPGWLFRPLSGESLDLSQPSTAAVRSNGKPPAGAATLASEFRMR